MNASSEIKKFIKQQNSLDTLRFITCGSVDDGKSTLLGRLLYEAQLIFDDQIDSLVKDSKKIGTQGEEIDFALLVDGLAAEREQGITIDVAYRFFSTEKRKFIVADSPGHEQYTRNMVTAASTADLAIILIDARKGVLEQTKRHSFIADMVGIKNIIVAVNKMDLINYDQAKYQEIVDSYEKQILKDLGFKKIEFIPISALCGDNIINKSDNMLWYESPTIINLLETASITDVEEGFFSMPVQNVLRPNLDFRGFSGRVTSGELKKGDELIVASSGELASVESLSIGKKPIQKASVNDSITLTLDKEIDISRGDILSVKENSLEANSMLNTNLIWLDNDTCHTNRFYNLKIGTKIINCKLLNIKNRIDINTYKKENAKKLEMNDICECEIRLDNEVHFTPYKQNKSLGSFILIDKITNLTVAAGVINHGLRRSLNTFWEQTEINQKAREELLNQKAKVIWLTGLSGAGKSTIAKLVEKELYSKNKLTYLLDGDNLRHGLNNDLGFTEPDRIENLRRSGEVAKLMHDAGLTVIASFISPFRKDRENIRNLFNADDFVEVYVECDIETLEKRDTKGLYKKAKLGEIPNLTGVSSPYEEPVDPELRINTARASIEECVEKIVKYMSEKKWL